MEEKRDNNNNKSVNNTTLECIHEIESSRVEKNIPKTETEITLSQIAKTTVKAVRANRKKKNAHGPFFNLDRQFFITSYIDVT